MTFISSITRFKRGFHCSLAVIGFVLWFAKTDAAAQIAPTAPNRMPTYGTVDPCAGTGAAGSSTYGACQLRQQTLSRGVIRAPNLSGLDRSQQLSVERVCGSDLARGQAVYAACLRRELGTQGYDPNTALRPLPDTQRHVAPSPQE